MKYENKSEAAHAWVNEFTAIPFGIIEKLLKNFSKSIDNGGLWVYNRSTVG